MTTPDKHTPHDPHRQTRGREEPSESRRRRLIQANLRDRIRNLSLASDVNASIDVNVAGRRWRATGEAGSEEAGQRPRARPPSSDDGRS